MYSVFLANVSFLFTWQHADTVSGYFSSTLQWLKHTLKWVEHTKLRAILYFSQICWFQHSAPSLTHTTHFAKGKYVWHTICVNRMCTTMEPLSHQFPVVWDQTISIHTTLFRIGWTGYTALWDHCTVRQEIWQGYFLIPFHLKFHLSHKPTSYCECTGRVESIDIRFVLSEFDLVPTSVFMEYLHTHE